MNGKTLIETMAAGVGAVPARAEVIALRQYSLDELERRAKRFLSTTAEACALALDRGDWVVGQDRTLIRLPQGVRGVVYHASGAMELTVGLPPMEALFKRAEDREELVRRLEKTADRLNVAEWVGPNQSLRFERLWQIKASAADRNEKAVKPVLCRVVGAYRHVVGELAVWGPASVSIKLAGEGVLDSLAVQLREPTGEVLDRAEIVRPEEAARQMVLQLEALLGNPKVDLGQVVRPQWLRFGYLSLPKRAAQRLLAPAYVAAVSIAGQPEAQAYLLAVPGTVKPYLPLCLNGSAPQPMPLRPTG